MSTPPYSRVRSAGPLLLTAGILGQLDGELVAGLDSQLACAFDNLESLLDEQGLGPGDVVRLVVYLTDIDQMNSLNSAFVERFEEPRPTRTTVVVAGLPFGALVEIEATVAAPQAGPAAGA